jgi:hypothetical protein
VSASQTPFLYEIEAGVGGPPIPSPTRAYFQQRFRQRVFAFLLRKFQEAQGKGLTKAELARRIGKTPDLINRWLGSPSNLQIDTICDIVLGISGEEVYLYEASVQQKPHNYSHFHDLASTSTVTAYPINDQKLRSTTHVTQKEHGERPVYVLEGA